jgi:ATP-dependent Clp protease adaptor protein ClpS
MRQDAASTLVWNRHPERSEGFPGMPDQAAAVVEPLIENVRETVERQGSKPKRQPRYNVILWNDNDHTYEYVIVMLQKLFGYPPEKGFMLAKEVDTRGRVIVLTTTKEHAELKRDQIHAYGKDSLIPSCKGSMYSTIEPVPGE